MKTLILKISLLLQERIVRISVGRPYGNELELFDTANGGYCSSYAAAA